jgi:uncharacterized iron-regulated membrane protein
MRKTHRYLGLLIGIQFLAWTLGGLYFSWTELDKVHGDDLLRPAPMLSEDYEFAPIEDVVQTVSNGHPEKISRIDLIPLAIDKAVYRVTFLNEANERQFALVDGATAKTREHLTIEEATDLAQSMYTGTGQIQNSEVLESSTPHDEFRGIPLPAYAFTFADKGNPTIYISAMHPQIVVPRSNTWRVFDFLWMLHTMDYQGRDDFNNYLIRGFAVFGLLTLVSGFALFFLSSNLFRSRTN